MFVDRLVQKEGIRQRLTDSIELAAKLAGGLVKISPLEGEDILFSEKFACPTCGTTYPGDRAPPVLVQQPGRAPAPPATASAPRCSSTPT